MGRVDQEIVQQDSKRDDSIVVRYEKVQIREEVDDEINFVEVVVDFNIVIDVV